MLPEASQGETSRPRLLLALLCTYDDVSLGRLRRLYSIPVEQDARITEETVYICLRRYSEGDKEDIDFWNQIIFARNHSCTIIHLARAIL